MTLVIFGGNNLIVSYLLPRLRSGGLSGLVVARRAIEVPEGFTFLHVESLEANAWAPPEGAVVISVLPLPVLVRTLPRLRGAKAVVAIGSTSLFSKSRSAEPKERASARALEQAEADLAAWAIRHEISYTILRPTLVYDGVGDRNIARMARIVRRFRLLVLGRPSAGLRQPIHADDVAAAIVGALDNERARNRAFNIVGGETLTYRAMAERVFAAQGIKPRLLLLPVSWLRTGFRLAEAARIIRAQGFGSAVFERMNEDLVFDPSEGLEVLNYAPRRFDPRPKFSFAAPAPEPDRLPGQLGSREPRP